MQLLLATTNAGKIRELKEFLGADYQILSLKDFPDIPLPSKTAPLSPRML